MKKFLSVLISVFILTVSLSICCFASETVSLSLQNETVYAGDEFTVNLFVSDNSKISGAVIDISYDNNKLEFVSAKEGAILDSKANISIRDINKESSYVRFTYMSGNSHVSAEGILFSVTFKVIDSAKGKTDLKISIPSPADFVSDSLEKIPYTVHNSSITILNNISDETTSETETDVAEICTENFSEDESLTMNNNADDNDDKKNDNLLTVVFALIGVSFICFGIAVVIKKKKS